MMLWSDWFFPMHAYLVSIGVDWLDAVTVASAYAWSKVDAAEVAVGPV